MAKVSAGLMLFRRTPGGPEVLLAHLGGPYFAAKDLNAWGVPKGEVEEAEEPLVTARREFSEETGLTPEGPFLPLDSVKQKSGKVVHAWAVEGDFDPDSRVLGADRRDGGVVPAGVAQDMFKEHRGELALWGPSEGHDPRGARRQRGHQGAQRLRSHIHDPERAER